jgi:DNA-binding NarL/FixJ family response regulator
MILSVGETMLSKPASESIVAPVRVLVVDDHALVGEALIHMLRETSALQPVGYAADSAAAIAAARELQPDVALVDLSLPGRDGIDTAQEIFRVSSHTRVIILSETESEESVMRALRIGVRGYVLKSLPFAGLVRSIERVLGGEVTLPRELATRVVVRLGSEEQRSPSGKIAQILTDREFEILRCLTAGETNRQIATRLVISEHTVRAHMRSLMQKLGVANRAQAAALAASSMN